MTKDELYYFQVINNYISKYKTILSMNNKI